MPVSPRHVLKGTLLLGCLAAAAAMAARVSPAPDAGSTIDKLPELLSQTGLYADFARGTIDPGNLGFSPQYPLWSDGTRKRRWIRLPAGSHVDASSIDAWEFPVGTRLWKEFSYGRPVETRMIERLSDGSWRFATYVWKPDGSDAVLAPALGLPRHPSPDAPGGRYQIPSQDDCRACHEGSGAPVLGFSALQLSPDRDPLAANAVDASAGDADLRLLVERGLLRKLPAQFLRTPPRIAASSPVERAALGYLHANCGQCHNAGAAPVPVELALAQQLARGPTRATEAVRAALASPARFRMRDQPQATDLVAPGQPDASLLVLRMRTRDPNTQMPPLGSQIPDPEGLALVERWIATLKPTKEPTP